jgi:hypothetical protein
VDSIPAIFAVTSEPFLVFTSNAFAILGLRALYFLLEGMIHRFTYLKLGLSAVLVFVGAKMLASDLYKVNTWVSLGVITIIIAVSVWASLRRKDDGAVAKDPTGRAAALSPEIWEDGPRPDPDDRDHLSTDRVGPSRPLGTLQAGGAPRSDPVDAPPGDPPRRRHR